MRIDGMEDLIANLDLLPREAKNLSRTAVHGIAGQARDAMRQRAPKATGTLRKAITAVRKRGTPTEVESDVIITHGPGQKYDAWYWHFVEFGTQQQAAQPFINPTVEVMDPKLPALYKEMVGIKLEALMRRKAKKAAAT